MNDPAFRSDPYPRLAELRESTPIFYEPRLEKIFLTRYADVSNVLRSRRFGTAITHVLSRDELGWPPPDPRQAEFDRFEDHHLLSNEPPTHTRLRGLVGKAFTPKRVEQLRERVAAVVEETLDALGDRGSFDLVADFAEPLPVILICELLGVGAEHRANLRAWSAAIVKMYELRSFRRAATRGQRRGDRVRRVRARDRRATACANRKTTSSPRSRKWKKRARCSPKTS